MVVGPLVRLGLFFLSFSKKASREASLGAREVDDDFEGVALVHEVLLAFGRVEHLRRVGGDERVEEGVET